MNIVEHMEYEWDRFRMDMMCTSRENIFSKASEIIDKRKIYEVISENLEEMSPKEATYICASDSIIDALYNCIMDKRADFVEDTILAHLHEYINR